MAVSMEATTSILSSYHHSFIPLSHSPISNLPLPTTFQLTHLHISNSTPPYTHKFPLYPSTTTTHKPPFLLHSSTDDVALLENPSQTHEGNSKRKLYVLNLPWSVSVDDLKTAFSQCGTVKDVELIKNKDGKNRGFAFVTMSNGDEAKLAVEMLHLKKLSGRTIKVEYARRLKKPRPQSSTVVLIKETSYKLYVSNLQWKVRSTHLRDFFSTNFKPVSARVVFESGEGRSAGYGFVSFNTREEAEAAIAELNGKELLGRPITLKFSERKVEDKVENGQEFSGNKLDESVSESVSEVGKAEISVGQPEEP